jgi:CRISPR type I-E-associated protein CasB/Cse2
MTDATTRGAPQERSAPTSDRRTAAPMSFRDQVFGVARDLSKLRRGPRAVLRRIHSDPRHIPPQPFWDLVARYEIPERDEPFWLKVIPLMVVYPHRLEAPPGRALAAAGVSPARVERWLRLDASAARNEAHRLLSHLKEGGLNWVSFAYLLRDWTDQQRRGFAREFFLSPQHHTPRAGADS